MGAVKIGSFLKNIKCAVWKIRSLLYNMFNVSGEKQQI